MCRFARGAVLFGVASYATRLRSVPPPQKSANHLGDGVLLMRPIVVSYGCLDEYNDDAVDDEANLDEQMTAECDIGGDDDDDDRYAEN